MSTLLIRADASTTIGTGHVMRCLALAQAWQDAGGAAALAAAELPPALAARLRAEGLAVVRIDVPIGSEEDAEELVRLALQLEAGAVILDGYRFGEAFQRAVKEAGADILMIDDCGVDWPPSADMLLNQNIHALESLYPTRTAATRLLLGCRYALLRREFRERRGWQREHPVTVRNVLLMLGGADPEDVTSRLLRSVARVCPSHLRYKVVVGAANPHRAAIEVAIREGNLRAEVLTDVRDMPSLMAWAEVAISAAGSSCWELAFMGLPTLLLVLADNQGPAAGSLHEHGSFLRVGEPSDESLREAACILSKICADRRLRQHMGALARELVDGAGAHRVVEAVGGLLP